MPVSTSSNATTLMAAVPPCAAEVPFSGTLARRLNVRPPLSVRTTLPLCRNT